MKHLLTAIACCLAVAGSAQTPYNPDSNGNGLIEVEDVLSLLAVFNTPFLSLPYSDEAIVVPFSEEEGWFIISDLAPIYIIDCRLDTYDDYTPHVYFSVQHEGEEFTEQLAPLNGTEFWFISNGQVYGEIDANFPVDCGEEYMETGSVEYTFNYPPLDGVGQTSQWICGEYDQSDELQLSKIIYLNGEFIRIK